MFPCKSHHRKRRIVFCSSHLFRFVIWDERCQEVLSFCCVWSCLNASSPVWQQVIVPVLWVCACAWNMFMQTLGARRGDFSYQRGQPQSLKVKLSAFPDHVSHSWNSLHIRPGQIVCFMDAAWEGYLEPAWHVRTMSCIDLNRTWFKMSKSL